ncbi:molybdopterin-dependent oxidoreductase [Duganella sp. sic0402]|uniref:xanthine dehydrogenase family protein molybdopterin-binding subunit n=1 Tax=Duganella sp. sic0402 TaxID=2854786 RepID=UPI001C43D329|nr:molybdopterin cofactor-binding domain-containing protein [Duganella sp. sic0402]MBV7534177.1 molybdopterin-dependent oxidoreductase [Duganella sp. sic0402]
MSADTIDPRRRAVLSAGALVLGFTLLPRRALAEFNGMGVPPIADKHLAGSLQRTPMLDAWIKIAADGKVTVFTGKAELGTGVRTALLQVAAEQLDVAPATIHFITADTGLTPNEGFTAGSHTMADSGTALLNAAAQVRALVVEGAAAQFKLDAAALRTVNGMIIAPDGRQMHYGLAVRTIDLHQAARVNSPLKQPRDYTVIGHSLPRVDIPAKLTGGAAYVQDMRLPGMVHARVVRPPAYGARLLSANAQAVERMPGVLKVHMDGNYLAVIASDEWQAVQAMRALSASARWQRGPALPSPANIHATLRALASQDIVVEDKKSKADSAVFTLKRRYTKQYVMHGSIGPSCSVALLAQGGMTVWTHTQGVYPLRAALAELLSMPLDDVRCIHTESAGCYGQNGADDVAADAALLARVLPGRPVRVQLMRDQENQWEPYAPAMSTQLAASLDADGKICDWQYELWSGSHNERPGNAGKLIPAQLLARPFVPSPSQPMPMPEGGGDRNAIPLYTLPQAKVVNHFLPVTPLRTSAMRSLGAHINLFAIEGMMDELAAAARTDPVAFRLRHMDDPRAREVIERSARQFGWNQRKRRRDHGFGFAFGQYKNIMAYVALAVEIRVERSTGAVHIVRVTAAVDCGQGVSPDGIRNQVEGGILQSASWTLYEKLQFTPDAITSVDWASYPIMRYSNVPGKVDVILIDRPGAPLLGVAEAAQGPMAGALGNALADATGKRWFDLPLAGPQLIG